MSWIKSNLHVCFLFAQILVLKNIYIKFLDDSLNYFYANIYTHSALLV